MEKIHGPFALMFDGEMCHKLTTCPITSTECMVLFTMMQSVSKGCEVPLDRHGIAARLPRVGLNALSVIMSKLKSHDYIQSIKRGQYRINPFLFWRGSIADLNAYVRTMEAEEGTVP